MIPRDQRHCGKGISLWWVRHAARRELIDNARFAETIAGAQPHTGTGRPRTVKLAGYRHDVIMETEQPNGRPVRILLDVAIDKPLALRQGHPSAPVFGQPSNSPECATEPVHRVLFAPRIWYRKMGIVRQLAFEDARPVASPEFLVVLNEGIARAKLQLRDFGNPRRPPSAWARHAWRSR